MLAARRRLPASLAGGWEFPGGKVEPGETDEVALIRECVEELGVRIVCGPRVPGEWELGDTMLLRVYLAELAEGEPAAGAEHDELRWLAPDELFEVAWLPGDLAALEAVRSAL